MLIKADKEKIFELKSAFYEQAKMPERSSYPLFSDGTKTEQDFFEYIQSCFCKRDYVSLFYTENGEVEGLIQFFTIPDESYLQLCGWYIIKNAQTALLELLQYVEAHYKGYELYFGFSDKNKEAGELLTKNGFLLIENDNHDVMIFSEYKELSCSENVRKIGIESFGDFKKLHNVDGSVYWNSDRILKSFESWNIYCYYENGESVAAVFETNGEIFGIDFKDGVFNSDIYKNLVIKVLNELKATGQKDMTFFNDDKTQQSALDIGFRFVGRYHLYCKKLV